MHKAITLCNATIPMASCCGKSPSRTWSRRSAETMPSTPSFQDRDIPLPGTSDHRDLVFRRCPGRHDVFAFRLAGKRRLFTIDPSRNGMEQRGVEVKIAIYRLRFHDERERHDSGVFPDFCQHKVRHDRHALQRRHVRHAAARCFGQYAHSFLFSWHIDTVPIPERPNQTQDI